MRSTRGRRPKPPSPTRMRGIDRKGRSKKAGAFVMIPHIVVDSAAFQSCKPAERAILIELIRRHNGRNNGFIALSARDAAGIVHVNKDTANKALNALWSKGLIDCARAGGFSFKLRHSSEWRLTWIKCNRTGALPSHAYTKRLEDGSRSQNRAATVP